MSEQTKHRIVVIGGGYAGVMATLRAAGRTPKNNVSITLVDAKPEFVERIRLHHLVVGDELKRRPYTRLLRGTGARFVQASVRAIDLAGKTVALDGDSGPSALGYDTLVYALGSHTDRDTVPGVRERAFTLDFADVDALRDRLAALPAGGKVVVCGGGLTGIEGASEIAERRRDLQVTLIDRGSLGRSFSAKGQHHLRSAFARLGVTLREQTTVRAIEADAVLTSAGDVPYDLCLWAGSFAVPSLAREAGLLTDERGRVRTDATLRSLSHPDVLVAGDAAAPEGTRLRMSCAMAMPLGAHAGDCAARLALGREPEPLTVPFAAWCVSLGRGDGLVQFVGRDETLRDRIASGRAGAIMKEAISRYTTASIALERRFAGSYHWLERREGDQPAAAAQLVEDKQ